VPDSAAREAPIPPDDRGFLYGDGLFETLVVREGTALWLSLHLDRLQQGFVRLGINQPLESLRNMLKGAARDCAGAAVLRLTVSRGSGERGYAPSQTPHPRLSLLSSPLTRDPLTPLPPIQLARCSFQLSLQPRLAGIKHLNRLEQVLAAREAQELGMDDVLMETADGSLYGTSRSNLFLQTGRQLRTPPCEQAGIAGTRRRLILERLAADVGLEARIERLTGDDLAHADGAFLCNSVMGLRGIARIDGVEQAPAPSLPALQQAYRERGGRCGASC
jgi:4-amino-4-deoxychorismate lyase